MKKTIMLLLFSVAINFAQTNKVTGNWLMMKAVSKNQNKNSFFIVNFNAEGKMKAMGMELGSWKYDETKNTILMNSKIDKAFNGSAKIVKLNNKEMILNKNGWKYFYKKIDTDKIAVHNKASGFAGMWQLPSDNSELTKTVTFELPDKFKYNETDNGSTETLNGTWIFLPDDNSIVIMSMKQPLRGINKVKEITDKQFILFNNGNTITATKTRADENEIERLTFKEEDLPEENDIISKLPWNDFENMISYLSDIKKIVYRSGKLNSETNRLQYETLFSKVKVNTNKPSVNFTNYEIIGNDTTQYSENYKDDLSERYNFLFPEHELFPARVTGVKTITVPAGTFECTVVEGFDADVKVRLYMINNAPGIFAKIIKESIDPFDKTEYTVEELIEFK